MKRIFIKAVVAGVLLTIYNAPGQAQEFTLRLSHVFPAQHSLSKLVTQYADAVKEETGGRVGVEILGAGQAFAERESYPAVAKGQVEATLLVSVQFSGIVPALDALSIPFLLQGEEQVKAFVTSDARKMLDDEIRTRRVEPLAWIFQTNTTVFTSNVKPLLTMGDFAGIKIRGLNTVADASLEANKASALSTPGSQVYEALQSGVLDAALTDISAAYSRHYYEIQKFGTVVHNWVTVYGVLIVNPAWLAKLPADVQAGLQRAAQKIEAESIATGGGNIKSAMDGLKEKGMTLSILDAAQEAEWAKAMTAPSKAAYLVRNPASGEAVLSAFGKLKTVSATPPSSGGQ